MFTWICPKCGREVPPSYKECPNCAANATTAAEVPLASAVANTPSPTPVYAPPTSATPTPSVSVASSHRPQLSPTLVAILATLGIAGLLWLLYAVVLTKKSAPMVAESSPALSQSATFGSANPLAKHLELSGLRLSGEGGRAKIQFVIVNHSGAELPELRLQVALAAGGKNEFEFPFTVPSLGPFESRDFSTTVKTKLKPYEWPDWQVIRPQFRVLD